MCSNAIAVLDGRGYILFHQCINEDVNVIFSLHNFQPNSTHAIHIHEYGDTRNGCMSLGGHWNPTGKSHGSIFIDILNSHSGDLINNFTTDNTGTFQLQYQDPRIVIKDILGRSIVIHSGIDDLGLGEDEESKLTGNAGGRIACGIIALAKPGSI